MTAPAVAEAKLPETLGWYRDAANWVVGLSTGALAAGITQLERVREAGRLPQTAFALSAVFFLLAVVSGIQFYLWLTSYGNARERRDRRKEEIRGQPDAAQDLQLKQTVSTMEHAQRRFGFFHDAMIWTFHAGIFGFAFVALWLLIADPKPQREWSVVLAPCDSPSSCGHRTSHVLKVEKYTGETRYLVGDSAGALRWLIVRDDTARTTAPRRRLSADTAKP